MVPPSPPRPPLTHLCCSSHQPLVGFIDPARIASIPQAPPRESLRRYSRQDSTSFTDPSEPSEEPQFTIPWVARAPPILPNSRRKEDVRIATKIDAATGQESFVFVSIRGGWKELPSYDGLTHDQRVQISTGAAVPLDQRFQRDLLQAGEERSSGKSDQQSASPVIGLVPLSDGAVVSAPLVPASLPDLTLFCQDRCAFCFDSLVSPQEPAAAKAEDDEPTRKRARPDSSSTSLDINGVTLPVHSLCSELMDRQVFQSLLESTASRGLIQILEPAQATQTLSAPSSCSLCGRAGGLLLRFSVQSSSSESGDLINLGHGLCLRSLALSGLLCPLLSAPSPVGSGRLLDEVFDKYQCSLCGQHKGLTFSCLDPTCHSHAHHMCALQAGWRIGTVTFGDTPSPLAPPPGLSFLCRQHSFASIQS
jgi:hypothetical protein